MERKILLIGYGNPSRGDDALGPLLLERLGERKECERLPCLQLQPEQVFEMENRHLVVFIDASMAIPAPFDLTRVKADADFSYSSHVVTPGALLAIYERVLQQSPPPCLLLRIRGEQFGLGKPLSAAAEEHLAAAESHLSRLLETGELPSLPD